MPLDIAPEKVAHVIIKAREYDAKVGAWDATADDNDSAEDPEAILQDLPNDPTRAEIAGFIEALNDDEQASLVALAWVGRGTFEPEDLEEAIDRAVRGQLVDRSLSARHAAALRLSRGGPGAARLRRRGRRERRALI